MYQLLPRKSQVLFCFWLCYRLHMCKMYACCVCYGHFAPVQTLETSHWSRQACSREPVTRDVTGSPPSRVSLIRWSITGHHVHLVSYCDLLTLCICVVWFRLNSRWWFWCRDRHLQQCWSYLGQQPLKDSATPVHVELQRMRLMLLEQERESDMKGRSRPTQWYNSVSFPVCTNQHDTFISFRFGYSSGFLCCSSGSHFLLLCAIKHNVLLLCGLFKLLHTWFWMLDRFLLNINVLYEITICCCFFVNQLAMSTT